jgi:hypothetical protein
MIGQVARTDGEQFEALQKIVGDHRQHDVQLEIARLTGDGDGASLPMTCAAIMATDSGRRD